MGNSIRVNRMKEEKKRIVETARSYVIPQGTIVSIVKLWLYFFTYNMTISLYLIIFDPFKARTSSNKYILKKSFNHK